MNDFEIQSGLIFNISTFVHSIQNLGVRFAIITDDTVAEIYGNALHKKLSEYGLNVHLFSFPCGEIHKTRLTKEKLEDSLFDEGFGSDTCVLGLGGGVVTDLAGYIAATFHRGIPWVTVPTTLLGMVDASIGGKTGVNVPWGKNKLGCIYQPKKVLIDPFILHTLPVRELRNGIVEMIKHALIADESYFEYLENHVDRLLALDSEALERAIFISANIKTQIVQEDEKDKGKRHLLNFGHTVGHALETVSRYSISHGEAVAIGLLVESHMAMQFGYLDVFSLNRIEKLLKRYGLPLKIPSTCTQSAVLSAMTSDKKSLCGRPRFVMINRIGSPLPFDSAYCTYVDEPHIKIALNFFIKW